MPRKERPKGKPVDLPIYGDADHNIGIYHAIGVLAITWASDESVFLALLQTLLDGNKNEALVIWFSHFNTASRLEVVSRLARQRIKDQPLLVDVLKALKEFGGHTRVRNFFLHAAYTSDSKGRLATAESITMSDTGLPARIDQRILGRETLNSVVESARQLSDLNSDLWHLVLRLEDLLQVPQAKQLTSTLRRQIPKNDVAGHDANQ